MIFILQLIMENHNMFTGIVETVGSIMHIEREEGCKHFTIKPVLSFDDLKIGDSIAINGICLTVTHLTTDTFNVTAVPETLRLTNLTHLHMNHVVNLERSLKLSDRLGGHYVQGHVDGMGQIIDLDHDESAAWLVKISLPVHLAKYVINKGYITLDGMSITVIQSTPEWFTVTFIPHTQAVTITQQYKKGSWINIEVDMMGKYIEKLICNN
jgi:riboflavin synthase